MSEGMVILGDALALIAVVVLVVGAIMKKLKGKLLWLVGILTFVGLFLFSIAPYCDNGSAFASILTGIYGAIGAFALDGDLEACYEQAANFGLSSQVLLTFLFVLAPILTARAVLSFLQGFMAEVKVRSSKNARFIVFSELNEQSYALAVSAVIQERKTRFVFCNVDQEDEKTKELVGKLGKNRYIFLKRDITTFNLKRKKGEILLFAIGKSEEDNVKTALELLESYRMRCKTRLYVFASGRESELLLSASIKDGDALCCRRVNVAQMQVYEYLYRTNPFTYAIEQPDSNEKLFHAVLVGLEGASREMLKALLWFGQMVGYRLRISVITTDEKTEDLFAGECPEIMDMNHSRIEGEAAYDLDFYTVDSYEGGKMLHTIKSLETPTFVVVSIGEDAANIALSIRLRELFEQRACQPNVLVEIRNSERAKTIKEDGLKNFRQKAYNIEVYGQFEKNYSYDNVLHSGLEEDALARHLAWGKEADFYLYEYNYRSSMATAIHFRIRKMLGIDEAKIPMLEHKRWNAYMRTTGYCYSGSRDKSSRNDLAKLHPDLVPFGALSKEDIDKDIRVGTK